MALSIAILPASAFAQAADDEYSLNIPGTPSGGDQSGSSTAPDTAPAPGEEAGSATPTGADAAADEAPAQAGGGGEARQDGRGPKDADGGQQAGVPSTSDQQAAAPLSAPADESNSPWLLIVAAALAALATAAAIWRLRQRTEGDPHGVGHATTVADEPNSL